MAESVLSFVLLGKDVSASRAIAGVGAAAGAASKEMAKVGVTSENVGARAKKAFDKVGKAAFLGVAGFAAYGVKQAADFQKLTSVYVTAAGESQKNLKTVQDGVKKVAVETGTAWKDVASATYLAEKAGYRGADAYKVVKAAAQGAKEENAQLSTVTDALTSALASYHLGASDSVMMTNELKTAAGESKTTFEEFAGSLSTILPIASANKISFADVGGVYATLTQHGVSAKQATDELAFAVRNLAAPNQVAQKTMAQLGISANDVSLRLGDGPGGRGLAGTLNYLSETVLSKMGPSGLVLLKTFNQSAAASADLATEFKNLGPEGQKLATQFEKGQIGAGDFTKQAKALGGEQGILARQFLTTYGNANGFNTAIKNGIPGSKTYTDLIKQMTGGANGLNVVLQASGPNAKLTAENIKRIADEAKKAGKDVDGWAQTQKNFSTQMDQFKQQVQVAAINLGTKLLPVLSSVVGFLGRHPGVVKAAAVAIGLFAAAWTAVKIGDTISALGRMTTAILGVGTASATAAAESDAANLGAGRGPRGVAVGGAGRAGAVAGVGAIPFFGSAAIVGGAIGLALDKYLTRHNIDPFNPTISGSVAPGVSGGLGGKDTRQSDALNKQLQGVNKQILSLDDKGQGNSTLSKQLQFQAQAIMAEMESLNEKNAKDAVAKYLKFLADSKKVGDIWNPPEHPDNQNVADYLKARQKAVEDYLKSQHHNLLALYTWLPSAQVADDKKRAKELGVALGNIAQQSGQGMADKQAGGLRSNKQHVLSALVDTFEGPQKVAVQALVLAATNGGKDMTSKFAAAIQTGEPIVVSKQTALKDHLNGETLKILRSIGINVYVDDGASQKLRDLQKLADSFLADFNKSPLAAVSSFGPAVGYSPYIPQADGSISSGRPGGIIQWAEAGGESFIPHAPSKRKRALDIWAKTAKVLGVEGFADGGFRPSRTAGIDFTLSGVLGSMGGAANQLRAADIAAQAAASAVSGGAGGAARWAPLVLQALGMEGLSTGLLGRVLAQMNLESGGNPNAINNSDSNAAIGQNSRGLLQTIPSTFAAYHWPGTSFNIYDPLANIAAAIHYGASRYGSATLGMGFGHGYEHGTTSAAPGWAVVGEGGPELVNFGGGERVYNNRQSRQMTGGMNVTINAVDAQSFRQFLSRGGDTVIIEAIKRKTGRG